MDRLLRLRPGAADSPAATTPALSSVQICPRNQCLLTCVCSFQTSMPSNAPPQCAFRCKQVPIWLGGGVPGCMRWSAGFALEWRPDTEEPMTDPRITKLANVLVNYSCAVKRGEKLLIEAIDVPHEIAVEAARLCRAAGGDPLISLKSNQINRALMMYGSREQWDLIKDVEKLRMENVQCYMGIRGNPNVSELSDVAADQQKIYEATVWKQVHGDIRVKKTRWVVLRWPSASMAQLANMSTEAFED